MPRLFPRHGLFQQGHSRHGRQGRGGSHTPLPLPHQQHEWSQLWDAVIQYSSRHLYCPAHRAGRSNASEGIATRRLAFSEVTSVSRMSLLMPMPASTLRAAPRPLSLPPLLHHARRPLSTSGRSMVSNCAALHEEQNGDTDRPAQSSTQRPVQAPSTDQLHQQQQQLQSQQRKKERHSTAMLRNDDHPHSIPDLPSYQQQQQVQKLLLWKFPEPTHRRLMPIEAWPSTNKTLADFYRSLNRVLATSPCPTSHNAYTAGHHQSSLSSSPNLRHEAALHHTMHLYKTLSDLQHRHGTILVPARHVRSLLLTVSRQSKTSTHLEHVLRLASDLLWLRSRQYDHRHPRNSNSGQAATTTALVKQSQQRGGGRRPSIEENTTFASSPSFPHPHLQEQQVSQISSPGLLVSEYTILMDWIGAFPADHETLQRQAWAYPAASELGNNSISQEHTSPTTEKRTRKGSINPTTGSSDSRTSAPTTFNSTKKIDTEKRNDALHNNSSHTSLAVDRVWAIWQAFQQTQMKPDIVLFTTLLNVLAKAQQFEKADQIWDTMMASLSHPQQQMPSNTKAEKFGNSMGKLKGGSRSGGGYGGPNLETFSVLLQAYASRNDVDGVAGVYQEIKKQQQQQYQQRFSKLNAPTTTSISPHATTKKLRGQSLSDVNTVLLNQILRLLVNVGEHQAAREIFGEMRRSVRPEERDEAKKDGQAEDNKGRREKSSSRMEGNDGLAEETMEYASTGALSSHRPHYHHHETFARRGFWRANKMQRFQEWRSRHGREPWQLQQGGQGTMNDNLVPTTPLSSSYPASNTSTGPDAHTIEIMLELARKEGDAVFETQLRGLLENKNVDILK